MNGLWFVYFMLCFDFWPPLYFYVSFGVFGVMSISIGLRLSRGVHGKLFDGLVFLGGYQGLHYIPYSKPSENGRCRNPPLPPTVVVGSRSSALRRGTYDLHLGSTRGGCNLPLFSG